MCIRDRVKTVADMEAFLEAGCDRIGTSSAIKLIHTGRFVKISAASLKESHPHDIHITKEAPNYSIDE